MKPRIWFCNNNSRSPSFSMYSSWKKLFPDPKLVCRFHLLKTRKTWCQSKSLEEGKNQAMRKEPIGKPHESTFFFLKLLFPSSLWWLGFWEEDAFIFCEISCGRTKWPWLIKWRAIYLLNDPLTLISFTLYFVLVGCSMLATFPWLNFATTSKNQTTWPWSPIEKEKPEEMMSPLGKSTID